MTPPEGSMPRPQRPRSASPAERSEEFAETQRRLKQEAAERRLQASNRPADAKPPQAGKRRGPA
jgi:hypothetical protein